jgi:hypothetical protein
LFKNKVKRKFVNTTPLHSAARGGNVEITKFLVSKGADVDAEAIDGTTPLHLAANVEIAKFLISKGAYVNATTKRGWTPLDIARGGEMPLGPPPFPTITIEGNTLVAEYLESIGAKSGQ